MKNFTTTFKLQIQTKDNKFKYIMSDFIVKGNAVYDEADLSSSYKPQCRFRTMLTHHSDLC